MKSNYLLNDTIFWHPLLMTGPVHVLTELVNRDIIIIYFSIKMQYI